MMRKLRILQINKFYHPWIGGVEKVVQQIAENLNPDKYECDVLVCNDVKMSTSEVTKLNGRGTIFKVKSWGVFLSTPMSLTYLKIYRKIRNSYDVLHFHSPNPLGELAFYLFGVRRSTKVVVTVHADIKKTRFASFYLVYQLLLRKLYSRADKIVVTAPENFQYNLLLHNYKSKIDVVPLCWEKDYSGKSDFDSSVFLQNLNINLSKQFTFLYFGRLSYYKGIPYLIKAMKQVDANLILAGDGKLRGFLEKLVSENNLREKVFFTGHLTSEEVHKIFSIAHVMVLPSISEAEAFGIVQLEAMKAGLPVINTNLRSGVVYVSQDDLTGYTVEPKSVAGLADAMNSMINDNGVYDYFSRNAIERAEKFNLKRMVSDYERIYAVINEVNKCS